MTKTVFVTIEIKVELDETKFTEEFMDEFRDGFYSFHTLDDHAKHLAQLTARGIYPEISDLAWGDTFIEGYGPASDMGIKTQFMSQEEEVESS